LVFVVFKPRWPRCAVVPDSISITKDLSELSVSECDAHMAYTYAYGMTTFHLTFLSVTHHIRTYVLCETRSSIQSLALMCSAIMIDYRVYTAYVHMGMAASNLDINLGF